MTDLPAQLHDLADELARALRRRQHEGDQLDQLMHIHDHLLSIVGSLAEIVTDPD